VLLAITSCGFTTAQTAPPTTVPVKTVLLRNGEMLEGRIVADSERLFVFPTAGGQINLPRANVQRLCTDPADAYRFLTAQISPSDTAARIQLVEWCLTHDQFDAARSELARLRTLSKRTEDINILERRLLMRIQSLQSQNTDNTLVATPTAQPARRSTPRSSHVSAEALSEFTRHIQPLLINGCAAAACHGRAATSEFKLSRPPRGYHSSQRLTQRNLSATLQQLDMVTPGESRLLKMACTPHGSTRAVYGKNATPAFQTIVGWVESVAGPIENEVAESLTKERRPDVPWVASSTVSARAETVSPPAIVKESDLPPMDLLAPKDDKPQSAVQAKDPFDADVFNTMFGG